MNKNRALRFSVLILAGLAASLVYTLAVGWLAIRAIGARDGAVFDVSNALVAVSEPHVPYLPMIAIALLGLLVAYVLLVGTRRQPFRDRMALSGGFSVGTAVVVVYSFAGLGVPRANMSIMEAELAWWKGWVYKAGSDSSVHLLLALVLGWMLLQVLHASRTPRLAGAKTES